MEMNLNLPEELLINVGTESREFAFKSKRQRPARRSVGKIIFSIMWLAFTSVFIYLMLGTVIAGGSTETIINGETKVISADNLKPALPLIVFLGVFVSIGLGLLISGIYSIFQRGAWFVGTPTRLIRYKKGVLNSFDWSQFNGKIEIRGSNTRGSITLEMSTGRMQRSKGGSYYVPDIIYFIGIPDVYEIEKIVRKRIEENSLK
ncbi:MAG: hypothetical protein MUF36_05050 [Bacteroidales bacterium]|jgi:hypothetical protein|nr:hypothetical protein [Bacteroidales bacterium]